MVRRLFSSLRQRLRRLRRQRFEQRLSTTDAQALARQAAPDASRVLVLRPDSIGDYLLYRPWLRAFSEVVRQRGQRLTLVANALWAPLAQTWDADLFDELLPLDVGRFRRSFGYRRKVVRQLAAGGFGEVVYPTHVREPVMENFIRFMKAPRRVASQGEGHQEPWYRLVNAGYTELLPAQADTLFEYWRNGEFFEHWLGEPALDPAPLALPASVRAAGAIETAVGPYIVLFPGASAQQKRWPAEHFAHLAQALHLRYDIAYRLVLAGSADDAPLARTIMREAWVGVPFIDLCGKTDLPGLAGLVAGAALLVSNDTVAAHLAAQVGTPCVVMLMGENYGKFFPYPAELLTAPCRCLFPPTQEARFARGEYGPPERDPDVASISVARVQAAAEELLAGAAVAPAARL